MIVSFKCKDTKALFEENKANNTLRPIVKQALRKLDMLHAAHIIEDLRIPPSNHLKALQGDRLGQYSIRINDKFRICFEWNENKAHNVEIVDYH